MINYYLEQSYSNPPCWELVSEVYARELGYKVKPYSSNSMNTREIASAFRLALHKQEHGFSQVDFPENLCIVLMGSALKLGMHHCGVYIEGKVLHALPSGTVYQDMHSLKDTYKQIQFWIPIGNQKQQTKDDNVS